jgi:hypothetical protein
MVVFDIYIASTSSSIGAPLPASIVTVPPVTRNAAIYVTLPALGESIAISVPGV